MGQINVRYLLCEAPEGRVPRKRYRTLLYRSLLKTTEYAMVQNLDESTVRSIFISDLHLGSRYSKATEMLNFLQCHRPENFYLVGDIIDAWALRRRWYWPPAYDALLNYIALLVDGGTELFYTPGNHDNFLRRFQVDQPPVRIQDQFVHRCADGRRMVILHGDQFDKVEGGAQWLSIIGSVSYDALLFTDRGINRLLQSFGFSPWRISGTVKQTVKLAVQFVSRFEDQLVSHARKENCDGIICGHIHVPRYRMLEEILYVNLGDWIENSTALVEYTNGRLELLDTSRVGKSRCRRTKPKLAAISDSESMTPMAARLAHQLFGYMFIEQTIRPFASIPEVNAVA